MNKRLLGSMLGIFLSGIIFTSYAQFSDVLPSHWAYGKIAEFEEKQYVRGYGDGTFRPDSEITKKEFAILLDNYYSYKIEESFKTNEPISRQEAVEILVKVMKLENQEYLEDVLNKFSDKEEIFESAIKPIAIYVKEGFFNGYEDGTLKPNKKITRAEAIQLLNMPEQNIVVDEEEKLERPTKPTKAEYLIEYYYNNRLEDVETRMGGIGMSVSLKDADFIAKNGYEVDTEAENIAEGNVTRYKTLRLKVYFKLSDEQMIEWLLEQTENKNSKAYEFFKRYSSTDALNSDGKNYGVYVNKDLDEYFNLKGVEYSWRIEKKGEGYEVYFINTALGEYEVGDEINGVTKYSEGNYSQVTMKVQKDNVGNKIMMA